MVEVNTSQVEVFDDTATGEMPPALPPDAVATDVVVEVEKKAPQFEEITVDKLAAAHEMRKDNKMTKAMIAEKLNVDHQELVRVIDDYKPLKLKGKVDMIAAAIDLFKLGMPLRDIAIKLRVDYDELIDVLAPAEV